MNNKILFVTHSLAGGGSERVLSMLANYFATHGYEIAILSRLRHEKHYPLESNILVKYVETNSHLEFIKRTRSFIHYYQPSNIIAFEYFYNFCAILADIGIKNNLIISERNDPSRIGAGFFKDKIRNFLYRFSDVLVCQTPDAKAYFPKYLQKKCVVIPNPLKPNLPSRSQTCCDNEVVTFCRLNSQKNLPMLLYAFNEFRQNHPQYSLRIFGDGEEKNNLQFLIDNLNLKESVFIENAKENVHELVKDAAMFVLPSDYEGLSNSMLEAIAIGIPSICTDCPCGGARMIINNGENGLLIPVGGVKELTNAMSLLADNKDWAAKISKNGKKLKEKLSIINVSRQWICLFQ